MKKLIIVESPSKAKTIGNFIKDATVIASKGHIRDLSSFNLGIKIDYENKTFTPVYEVEKDHKHIVKEIKNLAKNAKVYLATDEDREGEAISWHIVQELGGNWEDYDRIVFHEITKTAILKALENPRKLLINDVNSQQARRMLDRIIGFKLSSYLNKKVEGKLSVGRVQSATLKLIVNREEEIKNFIPIKYFEMNTTFKDGLKARYTNYGKQELRDPVEAQKAYDSIKSDRYFITDIEDKEKNNKPSAPFMTSTLQQSASSVLGFDPKRTMSAAQKLYEGVETHDGVKGVITYMRTDSLNLAEEAVNACREYIKNKHGEEYIPKEPRVYASKAKGAQEAHEAIRVTDINFTPELAKKYLEGDLLKVYELIYNRYISCQMSDAKFSNRIISVDGKENHFKINGRTMIFDGHLKYANKVQEDVILPSHLKVNDEMFLESVLLESKETEPPARYNEASLVKAMEDSGIGRPSTYAATISLITSRKYVEKENKNLKPTESAYKIVNFLDKNFPSITDINFTSKMEENLDKISHGDTDYNHVLADYWFPINEILKADNIQSEKVIEYVGRKCPKCNEDLIYRSSKFGKFIGCSKFPKCKYVEFEKKETSPKEVTPIKPCPKCKGSLVVRKGKGKSFLGCSNYPKCKYNEKYINNEEK